MNDSIALVRLDKWLWAARFFKTRALAKAAIEGGKVHYNKSRAKPSRNVELGATVRLQIGYEERTVIIEAISEQRRGAPEAQLLYRETEASITQRTERSEQRKALGSSIDGPDQKPNKKDRRNIIRFKSTQSDS